MLRLFLLSRLLICTSYTLLWVNVAAFSLPLSYLFTTLQPVILKPIFFIFYRRPGQPGHVKRTAIHSLLYNCHSLRLLFIANPSIRDISDYKHTITALFTPFFVR
jgi:hypothetical protein